MTREYGTKLCIGPNILLWRACVSLCLLVFTEILQINAKAEKAVSSRFFEWNVMEDVRELEVYVIQVF